MARSGGAEPQRQGGTDDLFDAQRVEAPPWRPSRRRWRPDSRPRGSGSFPRRVVDLASARASSSNAAMARSRTRPGQVGLLDNLDNIGAGGGGDRARRPPRRGYGLAVTGAGHRRALEPQPVTPSFSSIVCGRVLEGRARIHQRPEESYRPPRRNTRQSKPVSWGGSFIGSRSAFSYHRVSGFPPVESRGFPPPLPQAFSFLTQDFQNHNRTETVGGVSGAFPEFVRRFIEP